MLQLHNLYRQEGGEEVIVRTERELLTNYGHDVGTFEADNAEIVGIGGRLKTALGVVYSPGAKRCAAERIADFRPDVVHVHNFFPLLSPSVYYACWDAGVPVVQTLHNYRLICPNALLLRSGRPCEDCVGKKFAWPGILHACYRGSRLATTTVAMMTSIHHWTGAWRNRVGLFIALSHFSKRKLVQGGLPEKKIVVKPNFVSDPGNACDHSGGFALFVGRLSEEKGIDLLLSAWKRSSAALSLTIVGNGPLAREVDQLAKGMRAQWLGKLPGERVRQLMGQASFLVVPSICYENFPITIAEAFASGLPVVAPGHGSLASLVEHGRTGLHFRPGDDEDLAAKLDWAASHPQEIERMGREARAEYMAKYTPERNYEMLMEIYGRVTGKKSKTQTALSRSQGAG